MEDRRVREAATEGRRAREAATEDRRVRETVTEDRRIRAASMSRDPRYFLPNRVGVSSRVRQQTTR